MIDSFMIEWLDHEKCERKCTRKKNVYLKNRWRWINAFKIIYGTMWKFASKSLKAKFMNIDTFSKCESFLNWFEQQF